MEPAKENKNKKKAVSYAEALGRLETKPKPRSDPLPVLRDAPKDQPPAPVFVPAPNPSPKPAPRRSYADALRDATPSRVILNKPRKEVSGPPPPPALPLVPLPPAAPPEPENREARPRSPAVEEADNQKSTLADEEKQEEEKPQEKEKMQEEVHVESSPATSTPVDDSADDRHSEAPESLLTPTLALSSPQSAQVPETVEALSEHVNEEEAREQVSPNLSFNSTESVAGSTTIHSLESEEPSRQDSNAQSAVGNDSSTTGGNDGSEEKAQRDRQAMIRALDRGNQPLWDSPFGWDVLIQCNNVSWRVHRQIIVEESPEWIAPNIPPAPADGPTVWRLDSHDTHQLGNTLKFMYYQEYANAEMDPERPLEASSILTNVAMFIAGRSILCRSMMDYALDHIEDAIDIIEDQQPDLFRTNDIDSFEDSVRRALQVMYDQPDQWTMRSLRVVMARFMDVCLPHLWGHPAWEAKYRELWNWIMPHVTDDLIFCKHWDMLRPPREPGAEDDGQASGSGLGTIAEVPGSPAGAEMAAE